MFSRSLETDCERVATTSFCQVCEKDESVGRIDGAISGVASESTESDEFEEGRTDDDAG